MTPMRDVNEGGSGLLTVRLGNEKSWLPMRGPRKELDRKLVARIAKGLGVS